MARWVWIVSKDTKLTQAVIDQALTNRCREIVHGIPPALTGKIDEKRLPIAYEEIESEPSPVRDLAAEIDALNVRVAKLEKELSK